MNKKKKKMVAKKTWQQFRNTGLFWWINRILHTFGWVIVVEIYDSGKNKGKIKKAYPAKTKFRGFSYDCEDSGFKKISNFMIRNAKKLRRDCDE